MNELKKYIQPIKNFWVKLSAKTKKIIFISLGGVVLLSVVLGLLLNRTQYVVLYSGLDHDEAMAVMAQLKDSGVDYKESDNSIYVPSDKEDSMRMQLANEGYPKSAPNYNFFTSNVGVMTTDYEKKVIEKYQMNQRLEAVIKTLDPIENAYVTISIPDEGDYAWDDKKNAPTASVTVKMKSGQSLNAKQVNGIKQLVAKSVPNLKTENVSVIDNSTGEELNSADSDNSNSVQMDMTEFKLKVEQQYEDSLQKKIMNHLAEIYGQNNISISVKSQMDLDKKIQNIVTYQPTTSDGKGVVSESTEQHEETRDGSSGGGTAGTESNTETTTYPGVTVNGNIITTKDNKSYKYLVSQVQEQIQSDAAALQDVTVSIIVNDPGMTDAEVTSLKNAVAFASGVSADKVDVMSKSFYSSAQPANAQPAGYALPFDWRLLAAGAGGFLLIVILTVVLLARRRKKRAKELEEKLMQGEEVNLDGLSRAGISDAPTESIEQIRQSTGGKEEKVRKDLQEFSAQNPEIAAQLIRSWLKGEDDNA
ncbi:flagellar basal-body MS-ring/collar protein FliF [Caproicibacter sp.]|uniref:flagellar basal-body MS-ring/collar protein FliF n=1 Tax=Caproicibacter sp. TaxID=2814884 RepID=UPI003989788A